MTKAFKYIGCMVVACGIASSRAEAAEPATFEAAAQGAQTVTSRAELANLIDPLFAECSGSTDLEKRRCSKTKEWVHEHNIKKTFLSPGDEISLHVEPLSANAKSAELEVTGCIVCGKPIKVATPAGEKLRFLTTRAPKAIKSGRAFGLDVALHEVKFATAAEAKVFDKKVRPRLGVEFVWKLGATWKSGFEGAAFVPVAHRVFDRCTGQVLASEPPSTTKVLAYRDASCPSAEEDLTSEEREVKDAHEALPSQLARQDIETTLSPIQERVHDCFVEFEEPGTANVLFLVNPDGKVASAKVLPPFDKKPSGYCIKSALSKISFPQFKGAQMKITFPFYLR